MSLVSSVSMPIDEFKDVDIFDLFPWQSVTLCTEASDYSSRYCDPLEIEVGFFCMH